MSTTFKLWESVIGLQCDNVSGFTLSNYIPSSSLQRSWTIMGVCNIMAFMIINPVLYNNDNSNNNKTSTCSSAIILTRMQKAMQSSNKVKYNYKMLFEKIGKIWENTGICVAFNRPWHSLASPLRIQWLCTRMQTNHQQWQRS